MPSLTLGHARGVVTLSRRQVALLLVGLLGALALVGSRLAQTGTAESPARAAPPIRVDRATRGDVPARIVVHVVGAVRRTGLYRLPEGARVADAIRRSGGVTARAAVALVNLAAPLVDGQQVVVPLRPAAGATGAVGAPLAGVAGARVSLASATIEQLDGLPGIGPVTAQKIVDWRQAHGPFSSVDALDDVPGIGPARVEQLRDLVTP